MKTKTQYINTNYSYLYNNLSPKLKKKFSNIYRAASPVVIKTFGCNNYVYERKYKSNINNDKNDVYDYIENELKNSKVNRAHTTYTELSTQENMSIFSSQMQKTNKRSYKNYTNINNEGDYYIYPCNDNYFKIETNDKKTRTYVGDNNNYRYNILKKEGISELFIPRDNYYICNKEKKNKNHIELKSQSFCTSFIPEKKTKENNINNIFEIKYLKTKKCLPTKEIDLNISNNSFSNIKRESSFSKSKNQLKNLNIDKLKEIGDNFAMRYLTKKMKKIEIKNLNKDIFNKSVNIKNNGMIKNMINIEEKRKQSKNKNNLINSTNENPKNNIKINNNDNGNKNIAKTSIKNNSKNIIKKIDINNRMKIIKMDKKNMNNLKIDIPPNTIKIKLKHKIIGKKNIFNLTNNGDKGKKFKYYNNINNINNFNHSNYKIENKIFNHKNSPLKDHLIQRIFDKKKVNSPQKIKDSVYNSNIKIILNEKYKKMNLNNINHSYLESINIKKQNKTTKTKHSFNDLYVPSQ